MTVAIQIELNGQNGDNRGRTSPEAGEHRFQTLRGCPGSQIHKKTGRICPLWIHQSEIQETSPKNGLSDALARCTPDNFAI